MTEDLSAKQDELFEQLQQDLERLYGQRIEDAKVTVQPEDTKVTIQVTVETKDTCKTVQVTI